MGSPWSLFAIVGDMKLLLTSTGITNETIKKKFFEMAGKRPEEISLAFIPTAVNVSPQPHKGWMIDNIKRLDAMGIGNIDFVDFSAMSEAVWLPRLQRAHVLFVEGGTPSYLISEMKRAGIDRLLVSGLEDKVYVGCSAGSSVLGRVALKSSQDAPGYIQEDGLGLVNFSIRPHLFRDDKAQFTEVLIAEIAKRYGSDFYAIDDNSAVAVEGNNVSVVSEGMWRKFDRGVA